MMRLCALAAVLAMLAGCGGKARGRAASGGPATSAETRPAAPARAHPGDWTRFGYDAARTSSAPRGIPVSALGSLQQQRVELPGTVDSSPIFLGGVRVGGHRHDLLVMTTTYGITLGLDARSGRILWRFTPSSYSDLAGTDQITTATPVADPSRRFVFAASPDGHIHKLRVKDGSQVRSDRWPVSVTRDATHEKIASALNLDGRWVLVTTGGYIGDAPPYQGKVVAIDRGSGRLHRVWNSLCSDRRRIIVPRTCSASDSAIWGRAGAVVDPRNHHIFVATGNGPFDGRTNWGDSVLELSRGAGRLLRHYTPFGQEQLASEDLDLGSTSPVIVRGAGRTRYLLQGGKDQRLRLLSLPGGLHGVTGAAGRRLGSARQTLPQISIMYTAPAVRRSHGRTTVYTATQSGTIAYRLRHGRLHVLWRIAHQGSSPVLAGGVLWVYSPGGAVFAYRPSDGTLLRQLPAGLGHWNSLIVAGGRVFAPDGNANNHRTSGSLSIYAPR